MKRLTILLLVILSSVIYGGAQNLTPQQNKKGVWGYANEKGKFVIKPLFQKAEPFSSGLACVKVRGVYGYINSAGGFAISPSFEYAESFEGKFAKCGKNGKYGYIDTEGMPIVGFDYDRIEPVEGGSFLTGKKNGDASVYVICITARNIEVKKYDSISAGPGKRFFAVAQNGMYGYLSTNGTEVVSPSLLEPLTVSESGLAIAHGPAGYGLFNSSMSQIVPIKYSYVRVLKNGNYVFGKSDTQFGLLSKKGATIIPEDEYAKMTMFEDMGLIVATVGAKFDLLDLSGAVMVKACDKYAINDRVLTYCKGKLSYKMNLDTRKMAVCLNGKDVWTPSKASAIEFAEPFIIWKDNFGKQHFMTSGGTPVLEGYDKVEVLAKGLFSVEKDGKVAVANASCKLISEWVRDVYYIQADYVALERNEGYGEGCTYAILRGSNGKMMTGWDFINIYKPLENGLIPVKLRYGSSMSERDRLLKMMGDNFYVASDISEGMYSIMDSKTKKIGIMAASGKILVTPRYDEVGYYRCGMCRVWNLGKGNGFVNKSGVQTVACQYPQVLDFGTIEGVNNYTQVWNNYGDSYYIDKKGNVASSDRVLREAYESQRQGSGY